LKDYAARSCSIIEGCCLGKGDGVSVYICYGRSEIYYVDEGLNIEAVPVPLESELAIIDVFAHRYSRRVVGSVCYGNMKGR
jgi:hypothetical protein